ncbi:hypothetical protein ACFL6T_05750 [Candidatus Zixiibacteriota bacterium]
MPNPVMVRESGLALVGSMLLVSMLAVMSTTFLLLMAADVRIAQSHYRNTQAYYLAESAAEIASLLISAYPDTAFPADSTIAIVTDTLDSGYFGVYSYPSALSGTGRRQLRIRAASGKAWYDMYAEVTVPTQDPRTFYPVVAGSRLRLKDTVRIVGGDGVWQNGSGLNDPEVSDTVLFESPSAGAGKLFVSGEAIWDDAGVQPALAVAGLEIESNHPTMTDIYPQLLDSENGPYTYYITGDPIEHRADVLSAPDHNGAIPSPTANNPMAIYIWDSDVNGTYSGIDKDFFGTLVCPGTGRLRFENCDVTISPLQTGTTPDQLYPAIVSRGEVEFRGNGTFLISGLVYAAVKFRCDPSGSMTINGAVIADDLELKKSTTIIYNTDIYTMPAAAFASTATHRYPVIHFHRRRWLDLP